MRYRTALVTGASSGLGRALARGLAEAGALVVLCARRQAELLEVARAIEDRGGRARVQPLDVRDVGYTVATLRALDRELGGLDLIIAGAGVGAGPGPPVAWEALAEACHTNFCGAAATLTAVLPQMIARGRGHLVGLSSLASFAPLPGSAAYCAPKAGLSMLLACLRMDLRGTGVHVTAVHAGFVRTAMTAHSTHPMPQLMDCDEAAARILRALPAAPATLDFPQPLALAARLSARLPDALRRSLLGAVGATAGPSSAGAPGRRSGRGRA